MTAFDNSFARDLSGFYTPWKGAAALAPQIVRFNEALAVELGLDAAEWDADVLSGAHAPDGATPLAQVYAGHQFGGFTPQLGDGRALLLGEVINTQGQRRDIALKGSGRTPYSRGGDGKAAIGPVLREYLIGEAMHALGVPTTRALAATLTGEPVLREAGPLPGAVLTRVAASHLRVGTFQFFAARQEHDKLQQLLDYAIARHHPQAASAKIPALGLIEAVVEAQAQLVAQWMGLGFVHGVMNTDNMTISGETIDYGPCAFMDTYDTGAVFSSIDHGGRYAYGNQPAIAQWNLARLAEALLPLIDSDTDRAVDLAVPLIGAFVSAYEAARLDVFRAKLGLVGEQDGDADLIDGLLAAMQGRADFTRTFRLMAADLRSSDVAASSFTDPALYAAWRPAWLARIGADPAATADRMDQANPVHIPRNHLVEEALEAATKTNDYSAFNTLLDVITDPFSSGTTVDRYALPAPTDFGPYTTFCGT